MRINNLKKRKNYRSFLYVYVNTYKKQIKNNRKFFVFRINSKNALTLINKIKNWGYEINAVYYVAKKRINNETHSELLYKKNS